MIAETFSKVKNVWPQGHKIGKKDLKARKTVAGDVKRKAIILSFCFTKIQTFVSEFFKDLSFCHFMQYLLIECINK